MAAAAARSLASVTPVVELHGDAGVAVAQQPGQGPRGRTRVGVVLGEGLAEHLQGGRGGQVDPGLPQVALGVP